ncbi:MAG TPA: efflux RND transporter permease subunit [Steroidobacteraceae bacterium]
MWIVRLALRRPYTFIVLAMLIVLLGAFSIVRTPTDIFPNIDIPVISSIWSYVGLPPEDMANRIVVNAERFAQTTVNDVEHSESQSLSGIAVVKYFFQPNVNEQLAYAQITGVSQALLRLAPPGTTPPFILAYNASTVPILQLAFESPSLSEAQIFDLANTVVRPSLSTVAGASMPYPYGGKQRQVQVDIDPEALRAKGLAAADVSNAIGAQNLIIPAGTEKIGDIEYNVKLNSSPLNVADLNDVPIRDVNGTVVFVRDVANVHDGSSPQTNLLRMNGRHSVLMSVLKTGSASTLEIVQSIKRLLPSIQAQLPQDLKVTAIADQSIFVRAAVSGVIREGVIAAALTGLMILLFLGSWRSTLIITISIPLSVLTSIICLSAIGETINIMTLGGLALAVGILVDDATVAIENINWHLEHGKDVEPAILDGAHQIALPALVSTLCICVVFVPMFLLTGVSRFLFVPLAEAVVFAMLASYFLSRTLVPTLAMYWLHKHDPHASAASGMFVRFQRAFERRFSAIRDSYRDMLAAGLHHGIAFIVAFMVIGSTAFLLLPWLGRDFFPSVDAGEVRLHLRAPSGTRLEQTAILVDSVEAQIRDVIPAQALDTLVDNIGVPYSGINLSYSTSAPIGPGDADVQIALRPGHHRPTVEYVRALRTRLRQEFPSTTFSFLSSDIVSQILNFGLPAPFDVQVVGNDVAGNRNFANALLARLQTIPGAADLRIQQAFDYPQLNVTVDRVNAAQLGFTQQDVANNVLISLSGSQQTAPSFWVDPKSGIGYNVATQAPQYRLTSLQDLAVTPVTKGSGGSQQLLANLATIDRGVGQAVVSHYDARQVIDIYGSVDGTDLGTVGDAVHRQVEALRHNLPHGSHLNVRGQIETMRTSFSGLAYGMIGAILLIYLLIVVNFQSWLDPLIIISALPAALAGMVWMLFVTHTTISVPALIGAIMCMGVATANSILVVSFAREQLDQGIEAGVAALEAGFGRFRPVLMTALAMIIGMLPMSLGLGEGGEQNAPLGRAVIGGLMFATFATLLFVPVVFSVVHGRFTHASRGAAAEQA